MSIALGSASWHGAVVIRRARRRGLAAGLVVLMVSAGAFAEQKYWPRFRGPNGAGLSDATSVPVRWTEKDYNWTVRVPGLGHSSPVVWGRRIFLTSSHPRTAKRMVLCLDAADGHTLWQREYASRRFSQHRDNSYAAATPAADAHGVVVTWTTPKEVLLLALDVEGKEVWRRELGPFVAIHGSGASPVIVGDVVVLANDQADPKALPSVYGGANAKKAAGKSFLIAVDRKTGRTRWQVPRRSAVAPYSTPCLYRPDGGPAELIFSSMAHGITAVDPASGRINWEMGKVFRDRSVASPVVAPGLVIAGEGYGVHGTRIVAVRPGSRKAGRKPAVAYEIKPPVPLVPTPLVKGGRLFLWGDHGVVSCRDVATGRQVWRQRVKGSFYGSPVCVGERLYCIDKKGDVVVLAASDKFELLARVPLGEASFTTPAVSGGVMYLRTRSRLFSLGGKKP